MTIEELQALVKTIKAGGLVRRKTCHTHVYVGISVEGTSVVLAQPNVWKNGNPVEAGTYLLEDFEPVPE